MSVEADFNDGAELDVPPFSKLLHPSFLVPFTVYFACFRLANLYVKTSLWHNYTDFNRSYSKFSRRYRLQNLSICLLHSVIAGVWSIVFFFIYTKEMFENVIHWYQPWAVHLPIISIAYFAHDALDMINHEWSRWATELLLHHIAASFALLCGILPRKFLLANYWALLMEGNSIFLHMRTIMQISGQSVQHPAFYRAVIRCNIVSMVVCRFLSQALFVQWALHHVGRMHPFFACVAVGGPAIFAVINVMLFFRILVADGFLDKQWRSMVAINR
ncbi:unnamed protein product [Angiostrongylus costaricensis]|uniref:TLC domain-containing protein n=1 Tax=Angiostrongylus costaricensis TaxID=334426 RepID=A0A0R3PJN9_ANGCS|nr:unnamed protein product [Angiostrongylus costaricensis]